jgi:O-antigen/teichoic acid export membrane protein
MLVSLYTSRIVLKTLGVEDYGIYNVVGGLVSMFSLISSSMVGASSRFITFELGQNNFEDLKKTISGCITIHILLGLIIVVLAEILGVWFLNYKMNIAPERMVAANWVFQCSLLRFFFNLISTPFNAIIVSHEKMSAFAYISILEVSLKLLIVFLLTWILYDKLIVYALLMLFVSILLRVIYQVYCKKHFAEARKIKLKTDPNLFKQLFSFAGWEMMGSGALILRNQGINILLNLFFGVVVNAAKGVANSVQNAVYSFISNFQTAVKPQITKSYATGDYQRVHFLIKQGTRFSFYLFLLLAMPIMLETKIILNLWLVKVPDYSVIFVQLTFINLLINTFYRFMVVAIAATGRIKNYQIVVGSIKLLAFPLTYLFLKLGGSPVTGLLVVIFLEAICVFFNLQFVKNMVRFDIKDFLKAVVAKSLFVMMVALILPLLVKFYLVDINKYIHLSIVTIISLFSCGLSIYYLGLLQTEKQMLKNMIWKRFKKTSV